MPLNLEFELRLEERANEQVVVSVALAPNDEPVEIEGVALQWSTAEGEPISARLLLPIAGTVAQPMVSSVVLNAFRAIEPGCRVVATAWAGTTQIESSIPTDPFTELEVHVRGRKLVNPEEGEREPKPLDSEERQRLMARYPWLAEPRLPKVAGELGVVDSSSSTDDVVDEVAENYELDEESAAWLKELLSEDDEPLSPSGD
ncbi:MAG: hypothetical protein AAGA48_28260 [Myxococcota bacterium]